MKKSARISLAIVFVLGICLVSMGVAQADYYDPPGWDDNPYFTHQSWGFHQSPDGYDEWGNPYFYPEVDHNPYGVPKQIHSEMGTQIWHDSYQGRSGVWQYDETSMVDFLVYNVEVPELFKEVWFQATYYTADGQMSDISSILPEPAGDVTFARVSREEVAGEPGWYYETWMGMIIPQPYIEDFSIFFDGTVYVDQVDIDTRCVPIPSTVVLLCSGLMGLIALGRKERHRVLHS